MSKKLEPRRKKKISKSRKHCHTYFVFIVLVFASNKLSLTSLNVQTSLSGRIGLGDNTYSTYEIKVEQEIKISLVCFGF